MDKNKLEDLKSLINAIMQKKEKRIQIVLKSYLRDLERMDEHNIKVIGHYLLGKTSVLYILDNITGAEYNSLWKLITKILEDLENV